MKVEGGLSRFLPFLRTRLLQQKTRQPLALGVAPRPEIPICSVFVLSVQILQGAVGKSQFFKARLILFLVLLTEGVACLQRAYCQNCGITTRDKNFVIFAPLLALKVCWDARNFGNTPGVVRK